MHFIYLSAKIKLILDINDSGKEPHTCRVVNFYFLFKIYTTFQKITRQKLPKFNRHSNNIWYHWHKEPWTIKSNA